MTAEGRVVRVEGDGTSEVLISGQTTALTMVTNPNNIPIVEGTHVAVEYDKSPVPNPRID